MNRYRNFIAITLLLLSQWSTSAQNLPSTVSIQQWQDSWLAKWQSKNPEDSGDAISELACTILLLNPDSPHASQLRNHLQTYSNASEDARVALALSHLQSGFPDKAAKALLDLILKIPQDHRINRFRIGLARAFRQDGQFELAAAQLEPILDLKTPDGRWATLEQARLLRAQNDNESAIRTYQSILDSDSSDYLRKIAQTEKLDTTFRTVVQEDSQIE